MKKLLFGIFAHPDDEAFGPSASLYSEAHSGTDVHLVLVTDGEAGTNCDNCENLAAVRLKEWQKSGELIGVRSQYALHYPDGGLSNTVYEEIAGKILTHIKQTTATYNEPLSICFMTFDSAGITGHLDHIAVSYITTYVYLKLRESPPENSEVTLLKYYCLPRSMAPESNTAWIYMPRGKTNDEVDEIFDFSSFAEKKLEIMRAHYSQRSDMEQVLAHQSLDNAACQCDHFHYFKHD